MSHGPDAEETKKIVWFIVSLMHLQPTLSAEIGEKYLKEGDDNFFRLLLVHRETIFRQGFALILNKILSIEASQHELSFMVPIPQNERMGKLLAKMMVGLTEVGKNSKKMS